MDSITSISRMPLGRPEDDTQDDDELYLTQQEDRDRTMHDVHHVYFLLRQRLNADLARMIVQELEVYEIYRQKRRLNHMSVMQLNCPVPCFIGDVIRARARIQKPVRRVIFRFESHDQGYATHADSGSWTWFEAGIIPDAVMQEHGATSLAEPLLEFIHPDYSPAPPLRARRRPHPQDRARALARHRPPVPEPEQESEEYGGVSFPEYQRNHAINELILREQVVFRNSTACRDYEVNTVVWDHDDLDPAKADWVRALQVGDHIVVRAWARFPGWTNYVRAVSVTVCNAVLA